MGARDRFKHPEILTLQDDGITAEDIRALSEGAVDIGGGIAKAALRVKQGGADLIVAEIKSLVEPVNNPETRLEASLTSIAVGVTPLRWYVKIPAAVAPHIMSYFYQRRKEKREAPQITEEQLQSEIRELVPPAGAPVPPDMQQKFEGFVRRNEQLLASIAQEQPDLSRMGETLQHVRETLQRNQAEADYQRSLGHASNIVRTTTQLLERSDSRAARTFSTAANGCIQLYDAQRSIRSEIAKVRSAGLTIGSALSLASGVGTVLSVGSAIFGLFDDDGNDQGIRILMQQIESVRQDIRAFREEVAGAFNALSAQVGTFQQEMTRRLDELGYIMQHNGTRLERCIEEVYHVSYVSNRDEFMRLANATRVTRGRRKADKLPDLLAWATANCTFHSLTGAEIGLSPADIVSGLKDKSIEGKLGLLKKLAGALLPTQGIMPRYTVPNPMFWRQAVFAYLDTLASLPPEARAEYMEDEGFNDEFKQIIKVGTDLQEFVRQTQRNSELFEAAFKDYKDSVNAFCDEMVRSNNLQSPEVQKQLERIGRAYEVMRAFSELAFNGSFNEDGIFGLLMKRSHQGDQLAATDVTGKVRLLRLPNAEDLTVLFTQNPDFEFRKAVLIQVKQMSDIYKGIVDFKISSVLDRGAVEPYIVVEDTLSALRAFGREYIRGFREQDFAVQVPRVEGLTGEFMTRAISYDPVERTQILAISQNIGKGSFGNPVSAGNSPGRIVHGQYSIDISVTPAVNNYSGANGAVLQDCRCHSASPVYQGFPLRAVFLVDTTFTYSVGNYLPELAMSRPATYELRIAKNGIAVNPSSIKLEEKMPGGDKQLYFAPVFFNAKDNELVTCLRTNTYYFVHCFQSRCMPYGNPIPHYAFYKSPERYKIQIINLERGLVTFDYNMPDGQIPQRAYLDPQGDLHYEYRDATGVKYGIIGFDR